MDALVIDSMDYSQRRSHQGGRTGEPPSSSVLPAFSSDAQKRERKRSLPGFSQASPSTSGRRERALCRPSQPLVNPIFSASLRTAMWVSAVADGPHEGTRGTVGEERTGPTGHWAMGHGCCSCGWS